MSPEATRRPVPEAEFGGRLSDCFLLGLEVEEVHDRSSQLRSITFRSTDLIGFEWQPGQDIMFSVPADLRSGGDEPGDGTLVRRRYTIRRADADAGTLDIEVVLHGSGPFATWAAGVAPGDRIDGIGPRGQVTLHPDASHHLFVADESAVPVTFAMLEALPPGITATAVIATDDGIALDDDPAPPGADVHWVAVTDLVDRVGALDLPADTAAYLNGERSLVRACAAVLTTGGLAAEAIRTKAYWRRDQANAPHGEPGRD